MQLMFNAFFHSGCDIMFFVHFLLRFYEAISASSGKRSTELGFRLPVTIRNESFNNTFNLLV